VKGTAIFNRDLASEIGAGVSSPSFTNQTVRHRSASYREDTAAPHPISVAIENRGSFLGDKSLSFLASFTRDFY
jgi:hypothetical protein